jgi:tetratricopeptide (TPR) repeat protein
MKKAWLVLLALSRIAAADVAKSKRLYDEGMRAGNAGDLQTAVDKLQQSVAADTRNFLATFDLGGAYEALGDKDRALFFYLSTVRLKPEFVEARAQLATLYLLEKHDHRNAIVTYRAALLEQKPHIEPRFPLANTQAQAMLNLAIAYASDGKFGVARAIAESALNTPEIDHKKDVNLQTLVRRAEEDMAAASVRKLSGLLDGARKQLYGGDAEAALREYAAIEKTADFAAMTDFDRWDLYEGIGMANAQAKKPSAVVVRAFERARDAAAKLVHRKLIESTYNLACALAEDGKTAAALAQLEEALWLEWVTRSAPSSAERKPLFLTAPNDASFSKMRGQLATLVARYRWPAK